MMYIVVSECMYMTVQSTSNVDLNLNMYGSTHC